MGGGGGAETTTTFSSTTTTTGAGDGGDCWTGEAGLIPRRQRRAVVHREMQVIVGEERPHTESGHLCRILREYA